MSCPLIVSIAPTGDVNRLRRSALPQCQQSTALSSHLLILSCPGQLCFFPIHLLYLPSLDPGLDQGTSLRSTMAMALDVGSPYHGSPHHPDTIHYMSTSPASDPLQLLASNPAIYPAGYAGNLSLHNYRKLLPDSDPFIDGQDGKLLRRKNAALHLNQTQLDSVPLSTPFSMSSPGSSPPPLSPSYSPSARSDQDPDMPHGCGRK